MQYSDRQVAKATIRLMGFVVALTGGTSKIIDLAGHLATNGDKDLEAAIKVLGKEVADEMKAETDGRATPLPRGERADDGGNPGYDWQGPAERLMD